MIDELVSVGMPVYNGERFLEAAIRSNLQQTHPNFELIISDNASTDRTEEICRSYATMDPRVRYIRNAKNLGAAANYNRLFRLAKGRFFRWSNSDDLVSPLLIELTLPILASRPDVALAYGRTVLIDVEGNRLQEYRDDLDLQEDSPSQRFFQFYRQLGLTNVIYGLMRSSAMERTELMGTGKLPAPDVSFMAAMTLQGKFVELPRALFYRRMHEGAFSASKTAGREVEFWKASVRCASLPHWNARLAELKTIVRSPVPAVDKALLLKHSMKGWLWHRTALAGELLAYLSNLFSHRRSNRHEV